MGGRSQLQNRERALQILRAKRYEMKLREQQERLEQLASTSGDDIN
ncbi:hypothetical protein PN441_07960 [Spirulina major CS-329]|nr:MULTISPECIES: hypothetical protein [Spirulina]MDB9495223.1 hypothetical protein [Spirulina subsalsa CS-330]MDB9503005.1 hypothetical protein [Spirulina major CS-329]